MAVREGRLDEVVLDGAQGPADERRPSDDDHLEPDRRDVVVVEQSQDAGRCGGPRRREAERQQRMHDLTARIVEWRAANGQAVCKLELERELVYADDQRRRPVTEQEFVFLDAEGQPIPQTGRVVRQQKSDREVFTIRVAKDSFDRLEIRSLRELEAKRFDFEFLDIPLR